MTIRDTSKIKGHFSRRGQFFFFKGKITVIRVALLVKFSKITLQWFAFLLSLHQMVVR